MNIQGIIDSLPNQKSKPVRNASQLIETNLKRYVPDGMSMTKGFEGFRSVPYIDTMGNPTIGYGFNLNTYPKLPRYMTPEQAEPIFRDLYKKAETRARDYLGESYDFLTPNQKTIITDMSYNLGNKIYDFKKLREAVWRGDTEKTLQEMINSRWFGQVGRRGISHVTNWNR